MIPTTAQALKDFIESDAYAYLFDTMRGKYIKEILDCEAFDTDKLQETHVKLKLLLQLDKEIRIVLGSLKFK
jgi:hypothetical protein